MSNVYMEISNSSGKNLNLRENTLLQNINVYYRSYTITTCQTHVSLFSHVLEQLKENGNVFINLGAKSN